MNKKTFYTLNLTWGILLNIIGLIVCVSLLIGGKKPKFYSGCIYFEVGKPGWGGAELGLVFLCSPDASTKTKNHEVGHAIQNCRWGPLMIPVICIPSAIRYHYRNIKYNNKGLTPPTSYDSVWFEGEATELGTEFSKQW